VSEVRALMNRVAEGSDGSAVFRSADLRDHMLYLEGRTWREMGEPGLVTVTVEAGDTLNSGEDAGP
jgi:hypothetical protein